MNYAELLNGCVDIDAVRCKLLIVFAIELSRSIFIITFECRVKEFFFITRL